MTALDLSAIYDSFGRDLRGVLLSPEISTFDEAAAVRMRARADRMISRLNVDVARWTESAISEAYIRGRRRIRFELETLGKRPVKKIVPSDEKTKGDVLLTLLKANGSIRGVVERFAAVSLIAARTARYTQVQAFSISDSEDFLRDISREAVLSEQSREWLQGKIHEHLRRLIGNDEFIEIGRRLYNVDSYAKMVARTSLREAQTAATIDLCQQYDNDLVIILGHGDDSCTICPAYEGEIFSLSGRDSVYPLLDDYPPFHPNCVHSMHATTHEAIAVQARWKEAWKN